MAEGVRTSVEIRPMSGHIGAEVHGVDLTEDLAEDDVVAIRKALLDWKVVFFRDQDITQEQHLAFGRRFGSIAPPHPTLPAAFPEHPEILLLDNEVITPGESALFESRWHTDVSFVERPPMGSILHGVIVPPYGGDTQWIDLEAAFEALSDETKEFLCGLHGVHRNLSHLKRGGGGSQLAQRFQSGDLEAVHPVVRSHPETGALSLFVNPGFTTHIAELTNKESGYLLAMLFDHMSYPEFTVRFRWEDHSIAFWDNRCTAHIVPTDVPAGFRRSMQRITLDGDRPVGPRELIKRQDESIGTPEARAS